MITKKQYLKAKKVVSEYERQLKQARVIGTFNASDLEYVGTTVKSSVHIEKIKNGMLDTDDFDKLSDLFRKADLLLFDLHTEEYGYLVIGLNRDSDISKHEGLILEALNGL